MSTRYTEARNAIDAPEAVGSPVDRPVRPLVEPDVTALSDYFDAAGQRHSLAYSVDAVRAMLAAERERCARIAETPVSGEQDDITMAAKDRIAAWIRRA